MTTPKQLFTYFLLTLSTLSSIFLTGGCTVRRSGYDYDGNYVTETTRYNGCGKTRTTTVTDPCDGYTTTHTSSRGVRGNYDCDYDWEKPVYYNNMYWNGRRYVSLDPWRTRHRGPTYFYGGRRHYWNGYYYIPANDYYWRRRAFNNRCYWC